MSTRHFPDPSFPPSGGIRLFLPKGVDPSSPAFQAAQQARGGGGPTTAKVVSG
jgi:hypothetical protein